MDDHYKHLMDTHQKNLTDALSMYEWMNVPIFAHWVEVEESIHTGESRTENTEPS